MPSNYPRFHLYPRKSRTCSRFVTQSHVSRGKGSNLGVPINRSAAEFSFPSGGPISWRGLLILFQNTVVVRHVTANWFRCRLGPSEALTLTFLEALVVGSSALPGGSIGPWHWLRDGSLVNMVIQALSLSLSPYEPFVSRTSGCHGGGK